jgi:hypothetical protein
LDNVKFDLCDPTSNHSQPIRIAEVLGIEVPLLGRAHKVIFRS